MTSGTADIASTSLISESLISWEQCQPNFGLHSSKYCGKHKFYQGTQNMAFIGGHLNKQLLRDIIRWCPDQG
jgi:hypothetical protein